MDPPLPRALRERRPGAPRPASTPAAPPFARWMTGNVALRLAATLSSQLLAFDAATRLVRHGGSAALVVGLVGACFNGATLVAVPFAGRVADVRGHERVLALAPLIGALSAGLAVALALVNLRGALGVVALLVARVAEGVGAACAIPTVFTLLSRGTERDAALRTRVMGTFEITALLGLIGGLLLSGVLWDRFNTRALLPIVPIYLLALPLLAPRGPVDHAWATASMPYKPPAPPALSVLRALASQRGHVSFSVLWIAVNAVVGLWLQYVPYLLILGRPSGGQRLVGGLSGAGVSATLAAVGVLYVGGTAAWSYLASRWARRAMLAVSVAGIVGMALAIAVVNHGGSWLWFVPVALCIAAQGGVTPAALSHLADLTEGDDGSRGTSMGVYSLLLGVGQFLGGFLGGPFVARWQLDGLLGVSACFGVVALCALVRMPAARPSRASTPARA